MKTQKQRTRPRPAPALVTEMLILPSGEVLVHNLTPAFARLLVEMNLDFEPNVSGTANPRSRTARS